jgi:hypothetical protein
MLLVTIQYNKCGIREQISRNACSKKVNHLAHETHLCRDRSIYDCLENKCGAGSQLSYRTGDEL